MENEGDIRGIYWPKDRRGTIKVWCPREIYIQPIVRCKDCVNYKGLVFGKGVRCDYKETK